MKTSISENRNLTKEIKRIKRIARLYSITCAYDYFTKKKLYSAISISENNYRDAEKWADFSNFIFGEIKHATPQDFLRDRNEMTEKAIDFHEKYVNILKLIDSYSGRFGLNSKAVDAFCKSVEYGYKSRPEGKYRFKCIMLKAIGHVQYPAVLSDCITYIAGNIDTEEFRRRFTWVGLSMKSEPVNIRKFARQMNEIEELYKEIEEKRNNRKSYNHGKKYSSHAHKVEHGIRN